MPPAYQKSASAANTGVSNIAAAFSGNVTIGDVIAVAILWEDPTATFTSCTKSAGTATAAAFVQQGSTLNTGVSNCFCLHGYFVITGTGTFTGKVTVSSVTSGNLIIAMHDVSGIDNSIVVDNAALVLVTAPGTATDAITTGLVSLTYSGDYLFCWTFDIENNDGETAGTNFTLRSTTAGTFLTEDQVYASTASVAGTFTAGSPGLDFFPIGMIAFKAAPVVISETFSDNANNDNW